MVSEALGKPVDRSTIAKIENKMYEPRHSVAVKIFETLYRKISETQISEVEAKDILCREEV
jgi:DNA-binding XRE family transcriptional regulator